MEQSAADLVFMHQALDQAHNARLMGEVPVGAVIVREGRVIATGYNQPISSHDPTSHAEINALRQAAQQLGNYRLPECELYVTLEPCPMCAGAMMHARLKRVVFGTADPKTGAAGSVVNLFSEGSLNHQTVLHSGVLEDECGAVLREFFAERRRLASDPNAEPAPKPAPKAAEPDTTIVTEIDFSEWDAIRK